MSHYFFDLRDGGSGYSDSIGVDLPNDEAARDHAALIAAELLKNQEGKARHWRLHVRDNEGRKVSEIAFVSHDRTLSHLSPPLKKAMEQLSDHCYALREAIADARDILRQSRALVARSRGQPHLVVDQGREILRRL